MTEQRTNSLEYNALNTNGTAVGRGIPGWDASTNSSAGDTDDCSAGDIPAVIRALVSRELPPPRENVNAATAKCYTQLRRDRSKLVKLIVIVSGGVCCSQKTVDEVFIAARCCA